MHLPHAQEPPYHYDGLLPTPCHCHHQNGRRVARSLEHNAPLFVYRHVCIYHLKNTQFSTWYMAMSPSAGITADAPLSDIGSKRYVALVLHGTFTTPSANYQLSDQKFCVVQRFVSLWLLLLWFDFEDDTPSCIDLERRRLLCDHLTLVLNRAHKAEMVCLKTTKCLPITYSSVVRAFAHGAMDRRIDPSWRTHWNMSRSTTGVTKAMVCAILYVGWSI